MLTPFAGAATSFLDLTDFLGKKEKGFTTFLGGTIAAASIINELLDGLTFEKTVFIHCFGAEVELTKTIFLDCSFSDCNFRKLIISGSGEKNSINYVACNIQELIIENREFSRLSFKEGNYDNIKIESPFITELVIDRSAIKESLSFDNSAILSLDLNFNCPGLNISNCEFGEGLWRGQVSGVIDRSNFKEVKFEDFKMTEVRLQETKFEENTLFKRCEFIGLAFTTCSFQGQFIDIWFEKVIFWAGINMESVKVEYGIFRELNMQRLFMVRSNFTNCTFVSTDLSFANLQDAKFTDCDLSAANLSGVQVNSGTQFEKCSMGGTIIDRYTLAYMDNNGGLSVGNLMDMKVKDDLATLKMKFSGMFMWIHLWSVVTWLAPYLLYILWQGFKSKVQLPSADHDYIIEKLWNFLIKGYFPGLFWSILNLAIFSFLILYNSVRIYLLYQTKRLEMQGEFSGYPVKFNLEESKLKKWVKFNDWAIWVSLGLVLLNTFLFLFRQVPH